MNPEEVNYKKALLFKIGIVVIIVAIFFLWLANLRNVFATKQITTDSTWEKISSDMDKTFKDAEANFSDAASSTDKAFVNNLLEKASSTVSTTTATVEVKKELTDLIKSATTTPKRISCPPSINCMPTIGEARPCVVPVGCEKITQIAY